MTHRLTYEPLEVQDSFRFAEECLDRVLSLHAANWRRVLSQFIEDMTRRFESLGLLTALLEGNRRVDVKAWFKEAGEGKAPPLPDDTYERLALVWQQIAAAMQKPGEGFFQTAAKVDMPYVMSMAFPGGSLGERFEMWRRAFIIPFVEGMRGWIGRIDERLPASGRFDLWDLALEVVDEPAERPAAAARGAKAPSATKAKKTKKKVTSKAGGGRKGAPAASAKGSGAAKGRTRRSGG